MDIWTGELNDVRYLDDFMLENNLPKPVPYAKVKDVPIEHLQQWCVERGVYQVVTEELISWLAELIQGKKALEICAGLGTIGRHLGIQMTDSYMQTRPEIIAVYKALGQFPISPPPDVLKMDANEAVEKFAPDIVIGSWVTQKYVPGQGAGSVFGVEEFRIVERCDYIHIGNDRTHNYKTIFKRKHDRFYFPWLVSRGAIQIDNHVRIWTNP